MTPRERHLSLVRVFALSSFVPLAGSGIIHLFADAGRFIAIPFHSMAEAAGALVAVVLAGLVFLPGTYKSGSGVRVFAACSLISIGILDIFHSSAAVGDSFVWFRSSATLAGGFFFSLAWFSDGYEKSRIFRLVPLSAAAAVAAAGVLSSLFPEIIPGMLHDNEFTTTAKIMNFTGGVLFLAGAARFAVLYKRNGNLEELLFTSFCLLLGFAGILFNLSKPWDAGWWFWHLLRIVAYVIALAYILYIFRDSQKRAIDAKELQISINEILTKTLASESDEEIARVCLGEAERLTGSRFGFIDEIISESHVNVIALSDPGWSECRMPHSEAAVLLKNLEIKSYWGRVLKTGEAQIVNDPPSDPDYHGTPPGHPPIRRFIGVPLKRAGATFGVIGLANKERDYTPDDQMKVEALAVPFIEALFRKRAEIELKRYKEGLEELVDQRTMEARRLNDDLKRAVARLESVNRELEAFSYSVSHDLRAPLRSIDGFSLVILEDYAERLDDRGRDYFNRIRAASQRMEQLITDLLNLSRISRTELHFEDFDLSSLVSEIASLAAKASPERKIEFTIAPGLSVNSDARMLRIVLENLLGNALKFTSNKPLARIEFGVKDMENGQAFFVPDNGVGFDMSYSEKLFTPFQRLHSAYEFPGSGIGLAIVQRIINRLGGQVWAEGEVDNGAVFYFTVNA
ncbi:MAG: GAF domain-containing protein [Deltaproteobacteria bacterium]|nr:GAF domain-containing protein [Deltaproteobacteria bacterium]